MGQKSHPKALRLGLIKDWDSRWLTNSKNFPLFLEEDFKIREYLRKNLKNALIEKIDIERLGSNIKITIRAVRVGVIIGRAGKGLEKIKKDLEKIIQKHRKEKKKEAVFNLELNVEEIKKPTMSAQILAQTIAEAIEKRTPYRRALKKAIEEAKKNKEVKGVKIRVSGRLDGAEISRSEWLDWGRMPLQTFRADIDYGEATAFCTYGTVGIKVWIYKGEVLPEKTEQ